MKVLAFTPTWEVDGVRAMRPECENTLFMQAIDGKIDHRIGLHNPYPIGDHRNVLAQYQAAQREFLAGDWDALLTLEHDHLLPDTDAVQRMLDTFGDVIYAPYVLRASRTLNLWQWLPGGQLGASLSGYPRELAQARSERVYQVCGVGFGCTLIWRRVLEAIQFRASGERDACPDLAFARDCWKEGFLSMARMDVPVSHWHDGAWLMPFDDTTSCPPSFPRVSGGNPDGCPIEAFGHDVVIDGRRDASG